MISIGIGIGISINKKNSFDVLRTTMFSTHTHTYTHSSIEILEETTIWNFSIHIFSISLRDTKWKIHRKWRKSVWHEKLVTKD